MVEQVLVTIRGGMMKLIDNDVLVSVFGQTRQTLAVVTLYRAEKVLCLFGFISTNQQVTEILVT